MDPNDLRPDLVESKQRHEFTMDQARSEAVKRRHAAGQRTIRENIRKIIV